jgi:alkaline phosphatase
MILRRWRIVAGVIALMVMVTLMSGCGGAVASVMRVTAAVAVLEDDLSIKNIINILADVSGYTTIQKAIAVIKKSDSSETTEIELLRNDEGKFEANVPVDPNASAQDYTVTVTAVADTGESASSEPVAVEVPPAESAE